jgi:hypothetical protein
MLLVLIKAPCKSSDVKFIIILRDMKIRDLIFSVLSGPGSIEVRQQTHVLWVFSIILGLIQVQAFLCTAYPKALEFT